MNRRITLTMALALGVGLLALATSDSPVKAQALKLRSDTGVITLGPNQMLRITVASRLDTVKIRFRRIEYAPGSCDAGVCKQIVSSQTQSAPITLAPGEGASMDFPTSASMVRGTVSSDNPEVRVTAMIINTLTGEIVAFIGGTDDGQSI